VGLLAAQGDVVVTQGETGSEMYFIGEGTLEVRVYHEGHTPCNPPPPARPALPWSAHAPGCVLQGNEGAWKVAGNGSTRVCNLELASLGGRERSCC
jgi:hypothetical protein